MSRGKRAEEREEGNIRLRKCEREGGQRVESQRERGNGRLARRLAIARGSGCVGEADSLSLSLALTIAAALMEMRSGRRTLLQMHQSSRE